MVGGGGRPGSPHEAIVRYGGGGCDRTEPRVGPYALLCCVVVVSRWGTRPTITIFLHLCYATDEAERVAVLIKSAVWGSRRRTPRPAPHHPSAVSTAAPGALSARGHRAVSEPCHEAGTTRVGGKEQSGTNTRGLVAVLRWPLPASACCSQRVCTLSSRLQNRFGTAPRRVWREALFVASTHLRCSCPPLRGLHHRLTR